MKPERRTQILDFIKAYQREHLVTPTYRQIADALGVRSTGTIHHHVQRLKDAGRLGKPSAPGSRPLQVHQPREDMPEAISEREELKMWRKTAARLAAERDQLAQQLTRSRMAESSARERVRGLKAKVKSQKLEITDLEQMVREWQTLAVVRNLRSPSVQGKASAG